VKNFLRKETDATNFGFKWSFWLWEKFLKMNLVFITICLKELR
jgi:hypothetical protein